MDNQKLKRLHKIYRKIPKIKCKGLCTSDCGVIGGTRLEFERMEQVSGQKPKCTDDLVCNYLKDGRCSIYLDRPSICRQYGVAEDLPCPHGCEAERVMTSEESFRISEEIQILADEVKPFRIVWNGTHEQVIQDLANRSNMTYSQMENYLIVRDLAFGIYPNVYEQYSD